MAINATGLSVATLSLRSLIGQQIHDLSESQIFIGTPNQMEEETDTSKQRLNLFIYNTQFSPQTAYAAANESPTYRMFGIAVPWGIKESNQNISAGEMDLRLAGEFIRVIHENPSLKLIESGQEEPFALAQLTLQNLTMEELNKVWSSQGNATMRLSIGFEMSLIPVTLHPELTDVAPGVQTIRVDSKPFSADSP